MWDKLKDAAKTTAEKVGNVSTGIKDAVHDFSVTENVKSFSVTSAQIVSDIDSHLTKTNSIYEVNSFRVSANMGVVMGMTLEINFSKTALAKNASNDVRAKLEIKNPKTGNTFQVLKSAFGNKSVAKVRDPNTGEVLEINTITGEILSQSLP